MVLEDEMLKVKGPTSGEGLLACVWSVAVRQDKKRVCVCMREKRPDSPSQESILRNNIPLL